VAQKKSAEATAARAPAQKPPQKKKARAGAAAVGRKAAPDAAQLDIAGMNLGPDEEKDEPPPKMAVAREKVLEDARRELEADAAGRKALSLVVVGAWCRTAGPGPALMPRRAR
jgi:elongation factor 1 alpha-like protein